MTFETSSLGRFVFLCVLSRRPIQRCAHIFNNIPFSHAILHVHPTKSFPPFTNHFISIKHMYQHVSFVFSNRLHVSITYLSSYPYNKITIMPLISLSSRVQISYHIFVSVAGSNPTFLALLLFVDGFVIPTSSR